MSFSTPLSAIPLISPLTPLVTRILGCNPGPMTLQGTNTYVIGNGKERLLIDTADGRKPEYFENLKNFLKSQDVTLSTIILTHWHGDHVGGVQEIVQNIAQKGAAIYKFPRFEDKREESYGNVKCDFIQSGHKFEVEGAKLKAIHTPGHTTDHIILQLQEENAIFSGDCILGEGTAVFEDLYDYMKSLHKILELNPKVIYPAHGALIENPVSKIKFYIDHRTQREEQIFQVLKENPTESFSSMEIVKIVYKEISENLHLAAAKNVSHHLHKLKKEDKIKSEENGNERYKIRDGTANL